ncbi:unnamed protein product [Sphenostylis stenocarpa]|uniref:Carbohydrate kinase PfkB domain-containing protein n=1 Tax=Sphenostylis stenocarpa TaxID=92480 RepID=A0AA86SNN4_9FABA|nr:unnamed protein product [Sphenostylis stenocarpa]
MENIEERISKLEDIEERTSKLMDDRYMEFIDSLRGIVQKLVREEVKDMKEQILQESLTQAGKDIEERIGQELVRAIKEMEEVALRAKSVTTIAGGVARNVAECMSKLGSKPFMIRAIGFDMAEDTLMKWKSAGLYAEGILKDKDIETPVVCTIFDVKGEVAAGVASVEALVTFSSPNEDKLIAMANDLSCSDVFQPLSEKKGIEVVLVTIGSNGVFLCNKEGPNYLKKPREKINWSGFGGQLYKSFMQNCPPSPYSGFSKLDKSSPLCAVHFPSLPASVVRLTGAGDCLVGGTLTSICAGLDIMQSVSVGIVVAKAAVEAEANVPNSFNLSAIAGFFSNMPEAELENIVVVTLSKCASNDITFVLDLIYHLSCWHGPANEPIAYPALKFHTTIHPPSLSSSLPLSRPYYNKLTTHKTHHHFS